MISARINLGECVHYFNVVIRISSLITLMWENCLKRRDPKGSRSNDTQRSVKNAVSCRKCSHVHTREAAHTCVYRPRLVIGANSDNLMLPHSMGSLFAWSLSIWLKFSPRWRAPGKAVQIWNRQTWLCAVFFVEVLEKTFNFTAAEFSHLSRWDHRFRLSNLMVPVKWGENGAQISL